MEEILISGAAVAMEEAAPAPRSAASWASIIAGAFVAASVTLILIALGSGVGFAAISPWSGHGAGVTAFAITTAIWLIVTQWISAALGGYIAGRLRTRWIGTHVHEVFFRDTAHGLITWAVATILVAAVAAGAFKSAADSAGEAIQAGAPAMSSNTASSNATNGNSPATLYAIDKLFRATPSAEIRSDAQARIEATHIAANAFLTGAVPDADRAYLIEQVVARTGVPQADAQSRVDGFIASIEQARTKLKADADAARKAAAQASIYLALSMLIGAFIASVSAALGGRIRDQHI
jgi:hypothetical protein